MTIRLLSRARHSLTWSFSLLKSYSYFKTQLKSQAQLQISIERCAASLGSKEHIGWIDLPLATHNLKPEGKGAQTA